MLKENTFVIYFKWQTKNKIFTYKNNTSQSVKHIVKYKLTVSAMDVVNIFNVEFITFLYYEENIIYQFGR